MTSSRLPLRPSDLAHVVLGFILLGLLGATASCKEERPQMLPSVEFVFSISLNLPEYSELATPGNVVFYPHAGYMAHGVYVVHELLGESAYAAYDATCVAHLAHPVATTPRGSSAICSYCKREYILYGGASSVDAQYHLQPYRIYREGARLTVHNP